MKKKLVLAYSGGLDTTVIIPWLKENYDYDIIAACVDVGQGTETDGLEEKAIKTGASKYYLVKCEDEFVTDYIYPILKADAVYEDKYLLGTSAARPLIAKKLVEIALKEGASAIAHGATGKGNDQVRFELTVKALAPNLEIIAPWRIWDISSREDEIKYLEERNIPVPMKKDDSYSRDKNLWHLSHEGLELEDPANMPNYEKLLKQISEDSIAKKNLELQQLTGTEEHPDSEPMIQKELVFVNPTNVVQSMQILETEEDVDNYINKLSEELKNRIRNNKRIKLQGG